MGKGAREQKRETYYQKILSRLNRESTLSAGVPMSGKSHVEHRPPGSQLTFVSLEELTVSLEHMAISDVIMTAGVRPSDIDVKSLIH